MRRGGGGDTGRAERTVSRSSRIQAGPWRGVWIQQQQHQASGGWRGEPATRSESAASILLSLLQNAQLQLRPKPRQTLDHALHRPHEAHSHGVHQHVAEEAAADAAVRGRQRGEGRFHPSGPTHPSTAALLLRPLTPASLRCSYTTCWWTRASWTTRTSSTRLTTATTSGSSA